MVTVDKVKTGILNYIDAEICGKLHDWRKWVVAAAAVAASTQAENFIEKYKDIAVKFEYMDDSGMIDLDKLYKDLLAVAERQGEIVQNFPVIGEIKFDKRDVSKLYEFIERA